MPGYPTWSISLRVPHLQPVYASPLPHTLHALPISFFSILSPEQYVVSSAPLLPRLTWAQIFSNTFSLFLPQCQRPGTPGLLTYLLTPWSRVLLQKLTGSATSQEIPRIFGTRRFITVLTSARHLSLS